MTVTESFQKLAGNLSEPAHTEPLTSLVPLLQNVHQLYAFHRFEDYVDVVEILQGPLALRGHYERSNTLTPCHFHYHET